MGWRWRWSESHHYWTTGPAPTAIVAVPGVRRQLMHEAALRTINSGADAEAAYAEFVQTLWSDEEPAEQTIAHRDTTSTTPDSRSDSSQTNT